MQSAGLGIAVSLLPDTVIGQSTRSDLLHPTIKPELFSLGIASYTFRSLTLEQTIQVTKKLQISRLCLKSMHLPLDSTEEQIRQAVRKINEAELKLYAGGVITMKSISDVNQAFSYAKAAGMEMIIGVPYPDILSYTEQKIKETGIKVAIHNHGPDDNPYPSPLDAHLAVKNRDKGFGLCVDIGHTVRLGQDLIRIVNQCKDRLLDVHIKDVSAPEKAGTTVEIGRGIIDIPAFLHFMQRIKYAGTLSLEYEKDEKDPIPGSAESIGYLRGIMAVMRR
jgi:inosose dehydratase